MDDILFAVAPGAVLEGFVQGLSGFAFGMTAMSVWVWFLERQLAATLAVFGSLTGQVISAVTVRRGFDLRRLLPFLLGGLVGIPIGVAVLPWLDVRIFKAVLGGLRVLFCPAMLYASRLPKITAGGKWADALVGGIGGVMGGLGGFTGIAPTLWCTLRGFGRDEQRAIIQNFNLSALLVTMGVYLARGIVTRDMLPMLAVVAPALLLPVLLGGRLYVGLSEAAFRKVVLGLLTASGVTLLAASLPPLLRAGWH